MSGNAVSAKKHGRHEHTDQPCYVTLSTLLKLLTVYFNKADCVRSCSAEVEDGG